MLELDQYFLNGEINISNSDWKLIKQQYGKCEIVESLNDLVTRHSIELPKREISIEKCKTDYRKLVDFDTSNLISYQKWWSKFDYEYPLSDIVIKRTTKCKDASNYFMQRSRHMVGSNKRLSIYRAWQDPEKRKKIFNSLFSMGRTHVNKATILQSAECKYYLPSAFKPTAAKAIYDLFPSNKILDMCAGWGDRLVASCGKEYHGFDPNKNIYNSYYEIISTHNLNASVQCLAFEDSNIQSNYYDIMFTSPPYFRAELYSQDAQQSCNRYPNINNWIDGFLFRSIDKTYDSLKTGGTMAINISDINLNKKRVEMCDIMNDYLKSKNMRYLGCYGLQLSKLPNTGKELDKIFAEPIWIWRK